MKPVAPVPRVALIGISGYGRIHLQLARECRDRGELEIVAAAVINRKEEEENIGELAARGTRIHDDYREMLRRLHGKIDLCLIPTGIHWHAQMTIAALQAGANVLVEKPLAGSVAEVEAIRAAERETGRVVAVGFQDYYDPGTAWLREELSRGAIGELRSVRFLGLWSRARSYYQRNDWAGRLHVEGRPVLDSPLNNAFAHFVMLSLYFAGAGNGEAGAFVIDEAELFRAHDIESFDTGVVRLHTARGVDLWFGASHACRRNLEPEILINGSAGRAGWRFEAEAWWEDRSGRRHQQRLLDSTGARRAMMATALRRLRDPASSVCTSELAGRHTEFIEALHAGAEVVAFPPRLVNWSPGPAVASSPEVTGLEAAMRRASSSGTSLATEGFVTGQPVNRR